MFHIAAIVIQRIDIYERTDVKNWFLLLRFISISHIAKPWDIIRIMLRVRPGAQLEPIHDPISQNHVERIIILARHENINIVIPGNEPVMSYCTDQCPISEKIPQPVLPAYPVYFHKSRQVRLLYFL